MRVRGRSAVFCFFVSVVFSMVLFGVGPAWADDAFVRSSPGSLSTSHASIDGPANCNDCHTGNRSLSNQKCLGCHAHSDLRARISQGKGYHATSKVKARACQVCHSEHRGRGFDLMGWRAAGGEKSFDHALAGWRLEGRHAAIRCQDCHKKTNSQGLRTYLGEDKLCGSCHKRDQPHGFTRFAMMKCERCHSQSIWKPPLRRMAFDHNNKNDAAMPLVGSHTDVSCAKCHPSQKFNLGKKRPSDCVNCHKSSHTKHLFDKKCERCHSPKFRSLKKFSFQHARQTKFTLGVAHDKLGCYDCHTKKRGKRKPDKDCRGCHGSENPHKSRFKAFGKPPKCSACHTTSSRSWKETAGEAFSHGKPYTKFRLKGKHRTATCRSCHRGKAPHIFEKFSAKKVGCLGCHQHTNAHNRQFSDKQCLTCHKMPGKIAQTRKSKNLYHGRKSRFPLVRGHAKVSCEKCHKSGYKNTSMQCGDACHEDSLHRGSLGSDCLRCHTPGRWRATRFDHTEDTDWPLQGLHKTVSQCADCHPQREYSTTPTSCSAEGCHAKDDVHNGRLGDDCEKCHLETGDNLFDHNSMSHFPVNGKHLGVQCSECHSSIEFKPVASNCSNCHKEPKVHKGLFGTACENCHKTTGFESVVPLHDVGEFSLRGSHDNIPCQQCHTSGKILGGTGNLCITCHRQDDIHSNSLSPRCGECHTQWSFAPARFDHATVGCTLVGMHRVLPCSDCHSTGNYGALSDQCFGCHRDTAHKQGGVHEGYGTCGNCHNTDSWLPPTAYGRESICR